MEPKALQFQFLQEITSYFSEERIISRGIHANVYMGVIRYVKEIAVKILHYSELAGGGIHDDFRKLSMLKHPNIVRFKGYCQHVPEDYADKTSTLLSRRKQTIAVCFEHVHNGPLQMHLSDEFNGYGWDTRYRIIAGICEGLNYVHKKIKDPEHHLDLRPDKIFLDKDMVPKLSVLSFSKHLHSDFAEEECIPYEAIKYYPPEYMQRNVVSDKFDVFCLGVTMIDIVTGPRGYAKINCMSPQKFVDLAEQNWKSRLQGTCSRSKLIRYCQQVKRCTEIAVSCVNSDRHKRPALLEIIRKFSNNTSNVSWQDEIVQRPRGFPGNEAWTSRMDDELNFLSHAIDGNEKPRSLKFQVLQFITKNFSNELKIGDGGCGVVYKGILLQNRIVAVKRLVNSHTIEDTMFHQEVRSMMMVQHQNTVRLLGYCSHTEEQAIEIAGTISMAQIRERLLCFEYVNNGSLKNHITDELRGLEWHIRYQIIKGICEGLHHLHKEKHIIHMDLKPDNILLDDHMVPKIADFGLSRIDEKSQTTSKERLISLGYCAPEYQFLGKMSAKSDIYSLGVLIIELMTGSKEKPSITKVLRRWWHRWKKSTKHSSLWCQQVTKCIEFALSCIHKEPIERPDILDIICEIKRIDDIGVLASDTTQSTSDLIIPCLEDMLRVAPLDMHLPFEFNRQISCSVALTNDTDEYFAFRISTTSLRPYCVQPDKGVVPHRTQRSITIALQAMEKTPLRSYCKDEFSVQSTRVDGSLIDMDITRDMFHEESGKVVDTVNLMVVLDMQELPEDL